MPNAACLVEKKEVANASIALAPALSRGTVPVGGLCNFATHMAPNQVLDTYFLGEFIGV
jgi:hypothetical protein